MKGKRILSAVLSAALLLQLSPLAVFAEDTSLLPVTAQTAQTEPAPEEPTPEPAGEETALSEEPAPEETAVPMAAPTPEPTAEPTAAPAPEETAAPDAAETPAPEPSAEPTAAPDPAAAVQALIDALPDEVTEDNAAAVEQALTDIDDAKQSLTDDELAGLDFSRYDAAANALLALWGEAPTDEVETLDNYQEPGKNSEGYYQITNESELRWFAQAVNGGKKSIKARLMNDITVDKNTQWTPIGTESKPFGGIFDGNGKTITGLTCTDQSKDYVGLVGYADDATIQNVTVQGSSFNGKDYIGAVCGFIVDGYITGCTNSGSTVSGSWKIGGIARKAKYTNVQRCVNTGKVSGINDLGGIVGCTEDATVQDCGNTDNVKPTGIGTFCGGIAGSVLGSSYIHNCYNTDSSTADKFYDGSCYHSNCYYLANGSGSTGTDPTAKTQAQFASGEVAFLLQSGERTYTTDTVWGQTLTGDNKQDYPVLGGDKVYQTTLCTAGYSNTQGEVRQHNYVNGVCSNCGASQPLEEVLVDGYYQIYTADQLRQFAEKVTSGNYNINARLMADIELNGKNKVLDDKGNLIADTSSLKEWTPIGIFNKSFTGTFDGNNKTIYGLYIKKTTNAVGLFVKVGKRGSVIGTVKDVTLADSYVSGNNAVGGICAYNDGGTLLNCHNTGMVSGAYFVGGVCGINRDGGTIQKCDNSGTVSGANNVGGVCGSNTGSSTTTQECYNTGTVSGEGSNVGGVCGRNYDGATLENSYNTGTVSGTSAYYVGGVCGLNDSNSTLKNSYNIGTVSGRSYVESVCGQNNGNPVTNCYYLSDSNDTNARTAKQFASGEVAYLLQKALDDAATESAPAPQVWGQTLTGENSQPYPVLGGAKVYQTTLCTAGYSNTQGEVRQHNYVDGVCSNCGEHKPPDNVGGYYQITNQWQLRWFADKVNKGETNINAKLMNNITINSGVLNKNGELNTGASANFTPWTLIGTNTSPFTGTFDGCNFTISGLYINASTTDYVGLFGCVGNGGTVKNVTLADSYVSGDRYVGGICGQNKGGTLQNCHNAGKVSGKSYVGGVCGYNSNILENSYNTGDVSGEDKVGGVCGQNYIAGTVMVCYNTGNVSGRNFVGGVCGMNNGILKNSYNTGDVSGTNLVGGVYGENRNKVRDCYYLADTSGDTTNGCTPRAAVDFQRGEVAFLLQRALGLTAAQVWGQNIGIDKAPVLSSETKYKVYETLNTSPCKGGFSNTNGEKLEHNYKNGNCIYCGQPEIAYTVTIPAEVTLGNTATIKATGVTLLDNKQLNVKVANDSTFQVALMNNNVAVDTCTYTVTNGGTEVNPGSTVLTADSSVTEKSVTLQFNKPPATTYSGTYTGTVNFTVSVDEKTS